VSDKLLRVINKRFLGPVTDVLLDTQIICFKKKTLESVGNNLVREKNITFLALLPL
jgi:hypothetical protein